MLVMRANIFKTLFAICGICALAPAFSQGPASNQMASFNVSPLRIDLVQGQSSNQLFVRNNSADQLALQVRLFAWSQNGGADQFVPSKDFVISPSIVRVDPQQTQTFHVIAQQSHLATDENAYRVVIDQLPGAEAAISGATQTRLRLTVPLFAGGQDAAPAKLRFAIVGETLIIHNDGARAARINNVKLQVGSQEITLPSNTGPRAVLKNSAVHWTLPQSFTCSDMPVRVLARIDQKTLNDAALQTCP